MAKKKGFGLSPLTNTIYYGMQDTEKQQWVGDKEDVTDDVIAVVYEWFMEYMKENQEYSITYPGTGYELLMKKRDEAKTNE